MKTTEVSLRNPVEGRFKYYLNDDSTYKKLKKHASNDDFEDKSDKLNDNSFTFQFSTGAYVHSVVHLVDFWKESVGKQINPDQTAGLNTSVTCVKPETDAGGKLTGHISKLEVEGEVVTITTYDTQVKMRVQGKQAMEQYTTRALIPYLHEQIKEKATNISNVNQYFTSLTRPKASSAYPCEVCEEQFSTKCQLKKHDELNHRKAVSRTRMKRSKKNSTPSNLAILSEQQLDSEMSGMESLDDSLPLLPSPKVLKPGMQQPEETEPQEEPPRSSTPTPDQEKAPAPPPTWARLTPPLPEGYSLGDSKTLPDSFLELALDQLTKVLSLPGQQGDPSHLLPDPLQLGCLPLPPTQVLLTQETRRSYFLCPESGLLTENLLEVPPTPTPARRSVIMKTTPNLQEHQTNTNTLWPSVTILNDETTIFETEQNDDEIEVIKKPTPGVGKRSRTNPVPPSSATFGACNKPTHAHPVHPTTHEDLQYKCDECDFSANWAGEFFNHKTQVHELQVPGGSSDPLLYFLAEQNEEYRTKLIEAMVNVQSLTEQIQSLTTQVAEVVAKCSPVKCTKCNYRTANISVMVTHMEIKHNVSSGPQPPSQPQPLIPDILPGPQEQEQTPQQKKQQIPQPKKQQIPQQQQEPPPSSFLPPSAQRATYAEQARGAPAQAHSFNCTFCRYKCSNQAKLNEHIAAKHEDPSQTAPYTLLIGDSRVKSLKPRIIEKALGNGLLSVPGSIRVPVQPQGRGKGHPGRAYCSSRDWPGAKFPAASLEDRVPELLAARPYTNLVLQAPSNDITNILKVQDLGKHQELAEQSARNTLAVVEQALRVNPSLQRAIILEHLPRADNDHLGTLSEHSNTVLKEIAAISNLRNRITIASSKALECNTETKIVKMFGARDSPRSDGIHLMGENGKQLYTDFVFDSIRSANLAWTSPSPRPGARQASRREKGQEEQGSYATGNRFGPLLN